LQAAVALTVSWELLQDTLATADRVAAEYKALQSFTVTDASFSEEAMARTVQDAALDMMNALLGSKTHWEFCWRACVPLLVSGPGPAWMPGLVTTDAVTKFYTLLLNFRLRYECVKDPWCLEQSVFGEAGCAHDYLDRLDDWIKGAASRMGLVPTVCAKFFEQQTQRDTAGNRPSLLALVASPDLDELADVHVRRMIVVALQFFAANCAVGAPSCARRALMEVVVQWLALRADDYCGSASSRGRRLSWWASPDLQMQQTFVISYLQPLLKVRVTWRAHVGGAMKYVVCLT
jgi:hypothetical protein